MRNHPQTLLSRSNASPIGLNDFSQLVLAFLQSLTFVVKLTSVMFY